MENTKKIFSSVEEMELLAMSRGIPLGDLVLEFGLLWRGRYVVLTEDGIFHFFGDGSEIQLPGSLVDISEISKNICDKNTKTVKIPYGIRHIGSYAFSNCTGLTDVTIPDSVRSIESYAFYNCSGLASVMIPDGVISILSGAFSDCTDLMNVTIPDSVMSIGDYAFSGCSGLTSVTIGNGVTNIEEYSFRGCHGLTSVAIPPGVKSIGFCAFYYCTKLKSITIPRRFENELEKIGIDRWKTKVSFSG